MNSFCAMQIHLFPVVAAGGPEQALWLLSKWVDDIKNHPWFKGVDWVAADNCVNEPPIK